MPKMILPLAILLLSTAAATGGAAAQTASPASAPAATGAVPASYGQLTSLFADWRKFAMPVISNEMADYSAAAMQRQASGLPAFRQRLAAIDQAGWPKSARIDYRLVEAEMNGLDFEHRVLQPWARDPTFYANVFDAWSDVPAHEGPYAHPNINLYAFKFPLNAADERKLTAMLAAVPAHLRAARDNLKGSNARDLWTYGDRAFKDQSATLAALGANTLVMRTLDGRIKADITGAGPKLKQAIARARAATDEFAVWVAAEAPGKTGPAGLGKENYNWYTKNVALMPYDWDQQVALLRRELDRSIASMRLEEARNRKLPPITPIGDRAAYDKMQAEKARRFSAFLAETGLAEDQPYMHAAIAAQEVAFTPPESRNFFSYVTANDPLPLMAHFTHWIDLARMREAPHASPIRRVPAFYNIYADRSEGFATAFEEITMQAGLYDDLPRGRELVWIMLANRAARGLASLYVQANEMDLAAAGKFHAEWTPRGWSDPASPLVGFEQLLYARQPGYGPSYVTGKLQLERLIADVSHDHDVKGTPFVLADVMKRIYAAGIIPVPLIEDEMIEAPPR